MTSRGNGREKIFFGPEDYLRFLDQLDSALELDEVILYAYACLPNHTHLLVETPLGNIHRFMQRLNTAYSMYFRFKHDRPGHCLQGRYGAKLVQGDEYLLRLTRYIHLNPVRTQALQGKTAAGQRQYMRQYAWSSYRGYVDEQQIEERVDYRWLELTERKSMKGRRRAYQRYVEGMIGREDDVLKPALSLSRYAVGDEAFCEEVAEELKEARLRKGCFGKDVTWPASRDLSVEEVVAVVVKAFGAKEEDLREHGIRAGVAKKVAVELCCEFTGQSQRQIGLHFGYTSNGAVGKQRQRLRELLAENRSLEQRLRRLRKTLSSV